MKFITAVFIQLLFTATLMAQHNPKVMSFKKMAKEKSAELHSQYPKVAKAKFKDTDDNHEKHKLVDKAWHDLWHNFTTYYHSKGLYFKKMRKVFVHLHFSETGHLDYFGYHFKGAETAKTQRFVELFKEYIKDHDFGMAAGTKFSQCGELHLLPNQGVKEGI